MARMFEKIENLEAALTENITMSMDGADKTTGLIGFKRYNIYKFDMKEWDAIENFIKSRYDIYRKCFNESDLAQSILSDLLNEGLISEK